MVTDRRCQTQHWARAHQWECGPLAEACLHRLVTRITSGVHPGEHDPSNRARLLNAWLEDAGREAAGAAAASPLQVSSTAAWVDELRTLCLLANTCLLRQGCANPSPIAAAYLKALAVRGQLCLRPAVRREKRRSAARNLAHAKATLRTTLLALGPVWQARIARVHARLLCALGGEAERAEALAVLREGVAAFEVKEEEEGTHEARALLLLELTQVGYYDGVWRGMMEGEAEALCRKALKALLQQSDAMEVLEEEGDATSGGGMRAALLATAAFRVADLVLVQAEAAVAVGEALGYLRTSLRHAAPAHFTALEAYMAHALMLSGRQDGRGEARGELEGERKRRACMVREGGEKASVSSSLLSLDEVAWWQLPSSLAAAGGRKSDAETIKGTGAPGMKRPPTNPTLGVLINNNRQPQQSQSSSVLRVIPTSEEKEGEQMEVAEDDDAAAAVRVNEHPPPPSSTVVASAHRGRLTLSTPPAPKRTRLASSYYPFHHQLQLQPRVTLPCWATCM